MANRPASWDLEVDVVSVGTGLGGLTSAIVAHDRGAKVAILDKAPKIGGICAYSGGEVFVPGNHKMTAEGFEDAREEGLKYLRFLAGGYADDEMTQILMDTGQEAAQYLEERAGVKWKTIKGFPDYHYPHAPGTVRHGRYLEVELFNGSDLGEWQKKCYHSPFMPPGITHDELFEWGSISCILKWDFALMGQRMGADIRGFGPGMMGYFIKAAVVDRAIPTHLETPVRELVVENGRVIGVRAEKEGKDYWVGANKGVILAIGGYDHHAEFAKSFEGLPEWHTMVQPSIEGDNLILGGEVGACLAGVPSYNLGMFFGYHIDGEEHEDTPLWRASWEGGYPHAIWVNQDGKRFCDESFYREYLPKLHEWNGETQDHPNYPPYLIFDSQYRQAYPLGTYLPGQDIPESLCAQADTPGELADKLGINKENLIATLERFNSFAEGGTDPDFNRGKYPWANMMHGDRTKPNANLGTVAQGPFYGIALKPVGVGVNAVGLKTNKNGQVVHVRGRAIEGLYACGNSAAPIDTGAGYQSGLSNLRGMTWGFIAAKHATAG